MSTSARGGASSSALGARWDPPASRPWCVRPSPPVQAGYGCAASQKEPPNTSLPLDSPPPRPAQSVLDDDTLHALWLQAVALYDTTPNPPPDFASVAATRAALRASGLVDAASFDVVVVAVMGHALHERGDKTLLDYTQARPQPKPARGAKEGGWGTAVTVISPRVRHARPLSPARCRHVPPGVNTA